MNKTTKNHLKISASLLILLIFALSFTACGNGEKQFYANSAPAESPGGELRDAVAFSVESNPYDFAFGEEIKVMIGIGCQNQLDVYKDRKVYLQISAQGCTVNGSESIIKEFPDYYTDPKYLATVEEKFFGYDEKIPQCFEEYGIVIDVTAPRGKIKIQLFMQREDEDDLPLSAELTVYYAAEGDILWFAEKQITDIRNGKPVYAY